MIGGFIADGDAEFEAKLHLIGHVGTIGKPSGFDLTRQRKGGVPLGVMLTCHQFGIGPFFVVGVAAKHGALVGDEHFPIGNGRDGFFARNKFSF